MRVVDMHEAKTHLSRLVEAAAAGEVLCIARAGRPLVKVMPLTDGEAPGRRTGLLTDIAVPDDFDGMGGAEVAAAFRGE